MVLYEWSCIDAQMAVVDPTNASHDTVTCGSYSKHEWVDVENGPTSLPCYVKQWEPESDGSGTPKIMSGRRCTRKCRSDGSMSTPVRRLGTTRDCTRKDGARRCPTALPSPWTVPQMSHDDTSAKKRCHCHVIAVRKRSCCIFRTKSEVFEDPT